MRPPQVSRHPLRLGKTPKPSQGKSVLRPSDDSREQGKALLERLRTMGCEWRYPEAQVPSTCSNTLRD